MPSQSTFSAEVPELLQRHLEGLVDGSGLSIDVIKERGYRSILGQKELADAGFTQAQRRPTGLLMPVHTPDGDVLNICYRPDYPRIVRDKELKYELPRGTTARLDVPPRCREAIKNPAIDLWLTEGLKKGDVLAQNDLCTVVLLGVWNFKSKNEFGGNVLLADFDYIALNGRIVNIVFDSDVMTKPEVRSALERLTEHLQRKGATVNAVYLPISTEGAKVGVDDYLLNNSVDDLKALVGQARPLPSASAPMIELLDEAPPMMSRPLCLINNQSYAASWLWVKKTTKETIGKDGNIIRHDPPIVTQGKELCIVRFDGVVFGPDNLEALALQINLADVPPQDKLWRSSGVKPYCSGTRPEYPGVFRRIVSVFDHFIDFDQNLGNQTGMAELSACFSLTTWFLSVFTVVLST